MKTSKGDLSCKIPCKSTVFIRRNNFVNVYSAEKVQNGHCLHEERTESEQGLKNINFTHKQSIKAKKSILAREIAQKLFYYNSTLLNYPTHHLIRWLLCNPHQ